MEVSEALSICIEALTEEETKQRRGGTFTMALLIEKSHTDDRRFTGTGIQNTTSNKKRKTNITKTIKLTTTLQTQRYRSKKGYDSLDRIVLVMNGRGGAGQVINLVHFQQNRLHHIVPNQLEPGVPKVVHHVLLPPGEKIINDNHIITPSNQLINQMGPHKSGATGHHYPRPPTADPGRDPTRPATEKGV
ncbi:hypothetical protein RJ639_006338 [Escallonia herrerae]|uniref:Uncharacterized protein n=1 Tax=Escallonia herrerae TaxID=1293975 RepID=A0AA89ATB7_9ASTE|nr:hypothetical protein RJ639_006338 [Escallonia herrerae]